MEELQPDEQVDVAYFERHCMEIENAFSAAMDSCVAEKPIDPLRFIGESLLEQHDSAWSSPDRDRSVSKPTEGEQVLRGMIAPIIEDVRRKRRKSHYSESPQSQSGAATPALTEEGESDADVLRPVSYSTASWLESAKIKELVEETLLGPLKEAVRQEKTPDFREDDAELEREFIERLSDHFNEQPIVKLLEEANLLEKLARNLYKAAEKLKQKHIDGDELGDEPEDRASKFFEDGASGLNYGELDTFYGGLDNFLGPPNPNLSKTVEGEHTAAEDSTNRFVVPNYHTHTTSQIEYWFVVEPTDERLATLGIESWPCEKRMPKPTKKAGVLAPSSAASADGGAAAATNGGAAVGAADGAEGDPVADPRYRQPRQLSEFEDDQNDINQQLRDLNMAPLQEVEMVCARLYTGPMYCKYNTVR